jgi:hypothetical protein
MRLGGKSSYLIWRARCSLTGRRSETGPLFMKRSCLPVARGLEWSMRLGLNDSTALFRNITSHARNFRTPVQRSNPFLDSLAGDGHALVVPQMF